MKDWLIRTIKTFIQAFFGVLIPAVCAMLQDGWPESWNKAYMMASDDRQEIAFIMDIPVEDVVVKSVTRVMPSSSSE